MSFNEVLRRLRMDRGLTQDELARSTGLTRSAIGMYESGSRQPKYEILEMFADFFNVDMNTLLGDASGEDSFTAKEKDLVLRFRQLNPEAQLHVSDLIDFELFRQEKDAKKEGLNLG